MKYLEELEVKVLQILEKNKELTARVNDLIQINTNLKEQNQQFEASLLKECDRSKNLDNEKNAIKNTIEELLKSINSLEKTL